LQPAAVLIHVTDVESALSWYQNLFDSAKLSHHESNKLAVLDINGFLLEIVEADNKVANGKSGTVLYWSVFNLDATLARFLDNGAELYRGPMAIENGLEMCQVLDPYGNLIGLRGKTSNKSQASDTTQ